MQDSEDKEQAGETYLYPISNQAKINWVSVCYLLLPYFIPRLIGHLSEIEQALQLSQLVKAVLRDVHHGSHVLAFEAAANGIVPDSIYPSSCPSAIMCDVCSWRHPWVVFHY